MTDDMVKQERERAKKYWIELIDEIITDKETGKCKNKSYPVRKIAKGLWELYAVHTFLIKDEMEARGHQSTGL